VSAPDCLQALSRALKLKHSPSNTPVQVQVEGALFSMGDAHLSQGG